MKTSRPIIYLIIVIIVGLVIISLENPWRSRVEDGDDVRLVEMKNFDTDNVGRIKISQMLSGAMLTKNDKRWVVEATVTPLMVNLLNQEGRPMPEAVTWTADGSRIRSELGVFSGLYRGTLVSKNPRKRRLYQVDDEAGLHLQLFDLDDNNILDVVIGKSGPDFTSTYVRLANSNDVYLVPRPMTGRFSSKASDWRNRKLWSVNVEMISGITIKSNKGNYSVNKEGDKDIWKISGKSGGTLDKDQWLALVGKFTIASAIGFADNVDIKQAGLDNPKIVLTLHWKKEGGITLNIGNKNKSGQYYAQVAGSDKTIYLLSEKSVESIPLKAPFPSANDNKGKK